MQHVDEPRRLVPRDAISQEVHDVLWCDGDRIDERKVLLAKSPAKFVDAGVLKLTACGSVLPPPLDLSQECMLLAQLPRAIVVEE